MVRPSLTKVTGITTTTTTTTTTITITTTITTTTITITTTTTTTTTNLSSQVDEVVNARSIKTITGRGMPKWGDSGVACGT
jgi:hypothetical protein